MDIGKQIIDQRITKILEDNTPLFESYTDDKEKQRSLAFLLLGVSAYLDIDIAEACQYITEGGGDGGFDAAYIDQTSEINLNVVLFQSKYKRDLEKDSNYPANTVQKAVGTVKNIFDPGRELHLNERSRKVVTEIHSFIADGVIPYVSFVMLNNGSGWNKEAQSYIDNEFSGISQVEFVHYNHNNILAYVTRHDAINETLALSGAAIKEDLNYKEVILGRISVTEIARLMDQYGDSLLERNIRKYLGINAVNKAIRETLLDDTNRSNFFVYNNGITMVCKDFKYNAFQRDNWKVRVQGMQIINGGQTCKTIHQTLGEHPGKDYSQTTVLLRLYAVGEDETVIEGITRATNNQNPVDFRDLKSNDRVQLMLEQGARDLGYTYKRKRDSQTNTDAIPLSVAAEAVFAVWRQKPHLAKYKKGEFFNAYYNEIFAGLNAAQMIIAVLIFRICDNNRKKVSIDDDVQTQRAYSHYLLSALIGKKILEHFSFSVDRLTHQNFGEVKAYFEGSRDKLYEEAERHLVSRLARDLDDSISGNDGRVIAAMFRRFDFTENAIKSYI
jgi:hypothetical protein